MGWVSVWRGIDIKMDIKGKNKMPSNDDDNSHPKRARPSSSSSSGFAFSLSLSLSLSQFSFFFFSDFSRFWCSCLFVFHYSTGAGSEELFGVEFFFFFFFFFLAFTILSSSIFNFEYETHLWHPFGVFKVQVEVKNALQTQVHPLLESLRFVF